MAVIGLGRPSSRMSGIPIRLPPRNICDVDPWVCRMTPANIRSVQGKERAVARLAYEPQPRGCNCCAERLVQRRPSDSDDEPKKRSSDSTKRGSWSPKKNKKSVDAATKKKQQKQERIRLLREKKRRCDFVTACCQGLTMTPCCSVESCGEMLEEKEQANFFIHADASPQANDCETTKPRQQDKCKKKPQADFPCQCRTCKYVDHRTDPNTGCRGTITDEKTVCYCTDEEKNETDVEHKPSGFSPCRERQTPGPCNSIQPKGVEDCGQAPGKTLFTAALTQEMLIHLVCNGIAMANCIPTKTQYFLDCKMIPDSNTGDINTKISDNNAQESVKVGEIDCKPDFKCHVYNCEQPQYQQPNNNVQQFTSTVKCTTMPDCTKIYDLDCQPDVTYRLNHHEQPRSPMPRFQHVYKDRVCQEPNSSRQCNSNPSRDPSCSSQNCPCRCGYFQGYSKRERSSGSTNPCGHICIPKGAVPGGAGDKSKSKFLIPLTFHPRMESLNSSYPCMDNYEARRRPPAHRERLSSIQENLKMYSSSRKVSEPKAMPPRLSHERISDTRTPMRSNETPATKPSSPYVSPKGSSGYYNKSAEGALDQPPNRLPKPPGTEVKEKKEKRTSNRKAENKTKNIRRDTVRKRTKQIEPANQKERPRSRSPSPIKTTKSKAPNNTTKLEKKISSKVGGQRPQSPPHFEDTEPSSRAGVTPRNDYEADLTEAMDKVRRRYLEQTNYDTTGSSSPGSRGTTATEPCLTPTYQEFVCLTEQINCLRKELKKYCSNKR